MKEIRNSNEIRSILNNASHIDARDALFLQHGVGNYPDYLIMVGDAVIAYVYD